MELKALLPIGMLLLLSACLKDEIPVSRPLPGDVQTSVAEMHADYRYQLYFSLEDNAYVSANLKSDWDLGFESGENAYHVVLNSSKLMFAAWTSSNADVFDTTGNYTWNLDGITGSLDSTAIGDWRGRGDIILVNRGLDEKGNEMGIYKLRIHSASAGNFEIEYAELNSADWKSEQIVGSQKANFVQFSFEGEQGALELEPTKEEWDLLFTQYSERLWDGSVYLPYLVTGVQSNRFETRIANADHLEFEDIDLEDVQGLLFESRIDRPGYQWKEYQFDEGFYKINTEKVYVIQTSAGYFYKLRFVDFYNDSGERGYPKFEFRRL